MEGPVQQRLQQPYLVYPKESNFPFAFAGIWESWYDLKSGEVLYFRHHYRSSPTPLAVFQASSFPIVLPKGKARTWLDSDLPLADVPVLLKSPPKSEWNAYPIGTAVKQAINKSLDLLQPAGPPLMPQSGFLFSQKLPLSDMGSSPARIRSAADNYQLSLFKPSSYSRRAIILR